MRTGSKRYVDPTGEDWSNPFAGVAALAGALQAAGEAAGNWWASSSLLDKLDAIMTVVGFIPGVDVISDAYFLGKAVLDVVQGRGDWTEVMMAAVGLALPVGIGAIKAIRTFGKVAGAVQDASKVANRLEGAADGAQAAARASDVGDGAKGGIGPVLKGQAGESAAGINPGKKARIQSMTGTAKYRVPDELTPRVLKEVKNVKELRMTPQIADFLEYARHTDRIFVIVVRKGDPGG